MESIQHIADSGHRLLCDILVDMPLKNKTFDQDEFILRQGEPIAALYWIRLGEYSMHYSAENGKTFSLGQRLVSNSILGELEYLTNTRCQFSVVANERIEVKVLPISVMNQILSHHAEIGVWLSQLLSKSYQSGMTKTMERFLQPLVVSIASDIYQRYIEDQPLVDFNQVFREAERFGCSERAYRRAITQLVADKYIEKTPQGYSICDFNKFQQLLKRPNVDAH